MDQFVGKRILVFNLNWLGDVIFSTAFLRNLRYNYPESYIACVIPERCYPVLKDNPRLNEILFFDDRKEHKGLLKKLHFVQQLRQRHFDTVFLLHRSFSRALISRLSGIERIYGYTTRKRAFLLSKQIIPPDINSMHRIDYYLSLLEKSGLSVKDRFTEFFVTSEDEAFAGSFLQANGVGPGDFVVGINAGGNWLPKRWPAENWARLADQILSELTAKVIITGASSDHQLALKIQSIMKNKLIFACGRLNIKQFASLSRRFNCFISSDTGPLHIANATGCKAIIALFGPTSSLITGPSPASNALVLKKDTGCRIPCYSKKCRDNACMKAISPEEVFDAVKSVTIG
jgi:lipopolysaccharide heptosyltransferase II